MIPRSYLYVPGDQPGRIASAYASAADAVVLDLEDSVRPDAKDTARAVVRDALGGRPDKPTWVRVNQPGSPWWDADLAVVRDIAFATSRMPVGVRIPKCERADDVRVAADVLGDGVGLVVLIESAAGLERAHELATCHAAVTGLALGEADLSADLRVEDAGLDYARARCVAAARAAGLDSPVQSVFTDVSDLDRLRQSTERGRAQGFFGRSAIHPRQVPVINEVFTPSADQVERANAVLSAARRHGGEPFVLPDGRFVDEAVVRAARRVLAVATSEPTQRAGAQ